MMERALAALAEDAATEVVCIVGKPPGPAVAARLRAAAARLGKACVLHFVGDAGDDRPSSDHLHVAATLEDCARAAVAIARGEHPKAVEFSAPETEIRYRIDEAVRGLTRGQRFVRAVYAGGTLAWEALYLLKRALSDVGDGVTGGGTGHRVTDFGADVFTVGRPHPMIDGGVRRDAIRREASDPATAVILLDVALGHGAHPDPAGELFPAIDAARAEAKAAGRGLVVVASVVGTEGDSQGFAAQTARLEASGVIVMPSNAQAARLAARITARSVGGV